MSRKINLEITGKAHNKKTRNSFLLKTKVAQLKRFLHPPKKVIRHIWKFSSTYTWRNSAELTRIFSLIRDSISIKLSFGSAERGDPKKQGMSINRLCVSWCSKARAGARWIDILVAGRWKLCNSDEWCSDDLKSNRIHW